jgi:hypothetical protein
MTRTLRRALLATICGVAAVAVAGASARSAAAPHQTGDIKVTGTKQVGSVLTVSNGNWANGPTSYTYQWYRCDNPGKTNCAAVAGQTSNRYTLRPEDAGHTFYASVTACNKDGCTKGESDPVGPISAVDLPANTAAPSVTGTPQVGQTLTAVEGSWANAPTSYAYQWLRCDSAGDNCGAIGGATAKTYAPSIPDRGATLRVRVTAQNGKGNGTATSGPTALVTGSGTGTGGGSAVAVSTVSLPDQLLVSEVKFSPPLLHSRAPFTAQVRVTDKGGHPVSGALVYVIGLPYAWLRNAPEVPSGPDGVATLTLAPTSALPGRASIVLFVRVRKPGESLLSGVGNRRLVQVTARF